MVKLTPPMGWNSWNTFGANINEALIKETADAMVESGLGISILPELILKRIPYHIVVKELEIPAYRSIGLALKEKKSASLAVKRFLEYLDYR